MTALAAEPPPPALIAVIAHDADEADVERARAVIEAARETPAVIAVMVGKHYARSTDERFDERFERLIERRAETPRHPAELMASATRVLSDQARETWYFGPCEYDVEPGDDWVDASRTRSKRWSQGLGLRPIVSCDEAPRAYEWAAACGSKRARCIGSDLPTVRATAAKTWRPPTAEERWQEYFAPVLWMIQRVEPRGRKERRAGSPVVEPPGDGVPTTVGQGEDAGAGDDTGAGGAVTANVGAGDDKGAGDDADAGLPGAGGVPVAGDGPGASDHTDAGGVPGTDTGEVAPVVDKGTDALPLWKLVLAAVLLVGVGLGLWWILRPRKVTPAATPQRRTGELLMFDEVTRSIVLESIRVPLGQTSRSSIPPLPCTQDGRRAVTAVDVVPVGSRSDCVSVSLVISDLFDPEAPARVESVSTELRQGNEVTALGMFRVRWSG